MRFRYFGLILFLLSISGYTQCQNSTTGIRVGYNSSMVYDAEWMGPDHKRMPGIHIGALYNYSFQAFDLQGELLVSTKGYQANSIGETYIQNLFLYLELPLTIRKNIFDWRGFQLYTSAGITSQVKVMAINLISEIEGVRVFDAGINLGIGVRYRKVSAEVRYTHSIINLDLIAPSKYNQTLSLGMNFYFTGEEP